MWNTNEDKNSMFLFVYRWQYLRFLSPLGFHTFGLIFLEVSAENSYKPCIYGLVFFLFFSLKKKIFFADVPSVFFCFFF